MPKSPCKDCPKRMVGCHSTCDGYIQFRKAKESENETIRKNKQFDRFELEQKRCLNYIRK